MEYTTNDNDLIKQEADAIEADDFDRARQIAAGIEQRQTAAMGRVSGMVERGELTTDGSGGTVIPEEMRPSDIGDLLDKLRAIEVMTRPGIGQADVTVVHAVVASWLKEIDD